MYSVSLKNKTKQEIQNLVEGIFMPLSNLSPVLTEDRLLLKTEKIHNQYLMEACRNTNTNLAHQRQEKNLNTS